MEIQQITLDIYGNPVVIYDEDNNVIEESDELLDKLKQWRLYTESNGQYKLILLPRWAGEDGDYSTYLKYEEIELTESQFSTIKGFIPIKEKKLFSRLNKFDDRIRYAPTLSDGTKGKAIRVEVPTIQESREQRLKELGL